MVDYKPGKPAGRSPVKSVPAKRVAAKAKVAAPVAAKAPAPVVAKATPDAAKPVVAAKPAPAPVKVPPAKIEAAVAAPKAPVVPVPPAAEPAPVAAPAVAAAPIPAPAKIADTVAAAVPEMAKEAVAATAKVADVVTKTIETITKPAVQPIQKGMSTMVEKIAPQSFVPTPEHFQALFGEFSTRAKTAVESSTKLAEEMGEFAKGNVEAVMTSSRVAAKGAETLGQEAATYSKKSLESATAAFKGFAAAKSPTELFKLQSDYARSTFDAAVAESSKFSETIMKLFGEITQPLSTRVAIAAEKIKTPAL